MQNLLEQIQNEPGNALVPYLGERRKQEVSLLDSLEEAVVQFVCKPSGLRVSSANNSAKAIGLFLEQGEACLPEWFDNLAAKIARRLEGLPSSSGRLRTVQHKCLEPKTKRHLQLRFFLQTTDKDQSTMVCLAKVLNPLTERNSYLEKRSAKLIAHANQLEASRRDMERQIVDLKKQLKVPQQKSSFDPITGLPARAQFLERGAAELQRCRRYDHPLVIIVAEVLGLQEIINQSGTDAGDLAISGFAQVCESAFRLGIDCAGRLEENRIGILLPETELGDALPFIDRLNDLIGDTPLKVNDTVVYLGAKTAIDAVKDSDKSIRQVITRLSKTL